MSKTFDIGISTAYGAAVRGGYAGTYEQFCADLARLADVLEEFLGFSVTIQTLAEGQQATASYENGILSLGIPKGDTGNGIQSISLLSTVGQVKTYRITYTNGNHFDFPVADGKGISNTTLNADYTLTITYTDGTTWTSGSIRGQVGATPHLTIGTVETLPPSQSASATITGTDENPVLNLGIPKGNTGEVSQAEFDALSDDVDDLTRQISDVESALNSPNTYQKIDLALYNKIANTRYITESGDLHLVSSSNENADAYKIDLTEYIGYSVRIKKVSGLNSGFYTVTSMCDNDGYQPMRWHTIESLLYAYDEWVLPITSDYPYLYLSKTHNAVVSVSIIMGVEQFYNSQKLYKGYLNLYGIATETNVTTRFHTDYISCPENTKIYYMGENNHSSICAVAFYDYQFNFISGISNGGSLGSWLSTTSPAGTKYVRISALYEKPWGIKIPLFGTNASLTQNKTIFVSISGNDSNDGLTRTSAVRSIQKAIDLNGKYILVREGNYSSFSLENKSNIHILLDNEYSTFVAGTDEDFPKIVIDSNNNETISVLVKNCADITLENIEVKNANVSGFKVQRSAGIIFTDCVAHDIATATPSNGNAGYEIVYSDCVFNNCVAYNIGIATTPTSPTYHVDGFNMHGTGNTIFNDCSAWNCMDDGISHHDACEGTINGGEWYHCGKGGVASPTHGAKVNIYSVYSHDNMYGLYAGISDAVTDRGNIIISNSIFLDNTEKDMYVNSYYHGFALNCVRQTIDATNIEFIGGSIPS